MRATGIQNGGMPTGKSYMGWWGAIGSPKQRGIVQYGISAFQQRPFAGALNGYIFNGYKRLAKQLPYSGIPFAIGYGIYYWASSKHEFLNSKAGHIEALQKGTAE
ncbi:hypothetical protein E3P86_00415 [Wallemia ichthyophaga]|uniref:Cytochrome b-c1 complex subunit 8 n=1 Tax=Wallemia ichthyophaga TaxID=245174 RepID=A0A4T0JHZ9_WALIC|nr:hypothetical protein E3P86_00415 [Wallemia ichthyophaga]